jgi:hypothetical protein
MISKSKKRLAIYTVLIGDKESLNDPLQCVVPEAATDLQLDFFCFTDDKNARSKVWSFRPFDCGLVPHEKASRLPKTLPHRFFPDYEHSLYIDNTVVFKRLPTAGDLAGAPFKAFRHPWRQNPVDEADIVVRYGLDEPDVVAAQMRFYAGLRALDKLTTLTAGTVLLRRHQDPTVQAFGEIWWEQILLFSKRDQLSLDLCAAEAKCPIEYFPGDKRNNDLFHWPVVPGSGRRILASFDADLYAWNHRDDPQARGNPRMHFLQHEAEGICYDRHVSLFRYACGKVGSSLGDVVAPRRCLVGPIQTMLDRAGASVGSLLVVGVVSKEPYSVDPEELIGASAAFKQYYRFGPEPKLFTTHIQLSKILELAPFIDADQQNSFGLIVVLGLSADCHANSLAKFLPLVQRGGQILLQFGSSLTKEQLQQMHSRAGYRGKVDVFHGGHITSKTAIPSSVVLLDLRLQDCMALAVNS